MAKRALLVGCNYPGTKVELHGCANDVKRMHTTLTTRFGFDEADILVLLDTDPSRMQPTGENIRSCLAKLVQGTEPGDFLVFHYSGHGTQVPQESGGAVDETGAEEAIVPTDMNLLTDDDFRELVDQIPGGATFTFLSDSCHSGGLIDAEKEQIGDGPSGGGRGLMGLMSQGLGLKTRGFHFPGGGGRRDEEEYGESEEGFERRGRRREGDEEEEIFGRRRREEGGYGGGEAEQFSEETGGRRGRREEEGYGGGHGKSEVDEFAELIGGGRGRREEEGYGGGEAEQFSEEIGGRRGRREEEGYGGGHGKSEVDEFAELIGGGRGRREEGNEGYDRDSEDEQYAGRRRQEEYEGYGRRSEEDQYAAELGGGRRRQEEYEGYGRGGDEEQYAGGRRRKEEYEGYGRGNEEEQYAAELGGGRRRQEEYEGYGRGSDAEQYAGGRQRKDEYEGGSEEEQYAAAGGRRRRGEGRYVGEAEEFAQLIGGDQGVTSKEIPVDMLTEILSERTGHKVDIGNIRTTLFDMFGDQASPTVKMFANLVMQQLQGGDQGGWMGAVSSVATQFLQGKLDGQDADQAASYLAPAQNAGNYRPRPQRRSQRAVDVGVLLSGCQSNETSADANPSNDPADSYGAFSNAIQTVLSETDGALSNRELILRVRKVLQSQGFKQHPCLYCSDENADGPFICN